MAAVLLALGSTAGTMSAVEARTARKSAEPKLPALLRQTIVQTDAGFVIAEIQPAPDTPPVREPALIPLGGAVRIDRQLLETPSNGKDNGDARI